MRGTKYEDIDFVAGCGEFGEERRGLYDVAEAAELDDECAGHGRICLCSSLAKAHREDLIVAKPEPTGLFAAMVSPEFRFWGYTPGCFLKSAQPLENP